jgi:hypothetical protein
MMRQMVLLVAVALCCPVFAQEKPTRELERLQSEAIEARKAAGADPTIKDAESPPVRAYLVEQKRRRLTSVSSLRQRLEQFQSDKTKENLLPILKEQLAGLESKPLEEVSFDSAYDYKPTTGLLGYSRKVRLLENTGDGKSIIQVENIALLIEGLETSKYASGKFLSVNKAILIGPEAPEQTVNGVKRVVYFATLIDLDSLLKAAPRKMP